MAAIITYWQRVSEELWDEKFWLPENITWNDVSPPSNDQFHYTSVRDLLWAIPVAFVLLAIRYTLERWCFGPLGLHLGVQSKARKKAPPIRELEAAYMGNGVVQHDQIVGLSKQLDWTERQVERWLRLRRASEKPTTLVKFTESCWRFFYYTGSFMFGCFCVWDKPWARDTMLLVSDIPHAITAECWWYCMLSCAFYWSLLFSQLSDVKRKDFLEMIIHHFLAIVLVSFTWIANTHRFMVMGFFMFDMSDVILELAKITKYAQFEKTATVLFFVMTITWMATRWVWYPFWILRMTLFDCLKMFGMCPIYVIFNVLLLSIGVLNAVWTYFILNAMVTFLAHGATGRGDPRSSDDEDVSEESEPSKETQLT